MTAWLASSVSRAPSKLGFGAYTLTFASISPFVILLNACAAECTTRSRTAASDNQSLMCDLTISGYFLSKAFKSPGPKISASLRSEGPMSPASSDLLGGVSGQDVASTYRAGASLVIDACSRFICDLSDAYEDLGQKRKSDPAILSSVLPSTADIRQSGGHVRKVPLPDSKTPAVLLLLLVSPQFCRAVPSAATPATGHSCNTNDLLFCGVR